MASYSSTNSVMLRLPNGTGRKISASRFHVKTPDFIKQTDANEGWIEFGRIPDDMNLDFNLPMFQHAPTAGDVILFPGSFFHNTVPFESQEERISLAFDFV